MGISLRVRGALGVVMASGAGGWAVAMADEGAVGVDVEGAGTAIERVSDEGGGAGAITPAVSAPAVSAPATPVAPTTPVAAVKEEPVKLDRRGKMRQLQDLQQELQIKQLELEGASSELLKSEQTVQVLQQELELSRKLSEILKTERDKAIEEARLASGLCAQVGGF